MVPPGPISPGVALGRRDLMEMPQEQTVLLKLAG